MCLLVLFNWPQPLMLLLRFGNCQSLRQPYHTIGLYSGKSHAGPFNLFFFGMGEVRCAYLITSDYLQIGSTYILHFVIS